MFGHNHYVPVLKGRDGEYGALRTLTRSVRQAVTPLLEMPPIPWGYEQERPAKTIDEHLKKVGQKIERAWGAGRFLFVDLPLWIPDSERMIDGEHPLEYVLRSLRVRAVKAIPVVGLLRSNDYLQACRNVVRLDERGVCVRMQREDFVEFGNIADAARGILEAVGAEIQDADLVLDLGALTPDERRLDAEGLISLTNRLPRLRQWRTFTVVATSFPRNLMGLPPSDFSLVPRQEWSLWRDVVRLQWPAYSPPHVWRLRYFTP